MSANVKDLESARASLLRTAAELVDGDRNAQYGDPRQDFQRTAIYWSQHIRAVLERKLAGVDQLASHPAINEVMQALLEPADVAAMMALLKLSRLGWSPGKEDSWVDLAGYAACGWDCARPD